MPSWPSRGELVAHFVEAGAGEQRATERASVVLAAGFLRLAPEPDHGVILDCRWSAPDRVSSCRRVSPSPVVQWWSATGFPPVLVEADGYVLHLGSDPMLTRVRRPDGSFVGLTAVFDPVTQAMTMSGDPRQPRLFVLTSDGALAQLSRDLDELILNGSMGAPLRAMAARLPHLFAVGENGHVVHGVLRDFELPRVLPRGIDRVE